MLGLTVSRRLPLRSMHLACFVCGVCTAAADDGDTAANIVIISSVIIHTFPIIWCLDVVKLYNLHRLSPPNAHSPLWTQWVLLNCAPSCTLRATAAAAGMQRIVPD